MAEPDRQDQDKPETGRTFPVTALILVVIFVIVLIGAVLFSVYMDPSGDTIPPGP